MDSTLKVPIFLVTANVGSLFEDVKHLLSGWVNEIQQKIVELDYPKFVAFHFQEIGGKVPAAASEKIDLIIKQLLDSPAFSIYSTVVGYFDQDYKNDEKFTALGALYLVHNSLKNVAMWNYASQTFVKVNHGRQIFTNFLDSLETVEKLKYPQRFFPQMKWSRKGYLKTRWKIAGLIIDLVNIHLFHDPSNLVSIETSPSLYAISRRNAFEHVLNSLMVDVVPCFIFGDFNFRVDQMKLFKRMSRYGIVKTELKEGAKERLKIVEKNDPEKVYLLVEPSKFCINDPSVTKNLVISLGKFDNELKTFKKRIHEFPVTFPPSYPFKEDAEITQPLYLEKRCPSWCDRVLMTCKTMNIIVNKKMANMN